MKRLTAPSGQIVESNHQVVGEDQLRKKAILVHSGPGGKGVTYMSGDGETKPFDDARIQRIVEINNRVLKQLADQYGGLEKMPPGAFPPVKDQHNSDSIQDVLGRMISYLSYERRDVPGVGKDVSCVCGEILFMGKETVERVKDGRIYHLSIGIDEETDNLGETSTVIVPAAPGAMLLTGEKGNRKSNLEKTKMGKKEKRLAAHKNRLTTLTALSADLKKMSEKSGQLKTLIADTRAKAIEGDRVAKVTHRLKKFVSEMRMTPAEFRALDFKKLSKATDETIDVLCAGLEARPKIELQSQIGSADAIEFAEIGKGLEKKQMKRLEAEIKGDFKKLGKKLKGDEDDKKADKAHGDTFEMKAEKKMSEAKPEHDEAEGGYESKLSGDDMETLGKHLNEGKMDEAKAVFKTMSEKVKSHVAMSSDVKSEDEMKNLDSVQGQIDELNTNMARLASMVSELFEAEKAEGHELGATEEGDTAELESGKPLPEKPLEEGKPAPEKKLGEDGKPLPEEKKLGEDGKPLPEEKKLEGDGKEKPEPKKEEKESKPGDKA